MTAKAMEKTLSEDEIIAFLRREKDFFRRHPDVLEDMDAPGETSGKGVADFQRALLERFKADKTKSQHMHRELLETARANMNNYARIQTAVLVLLEAESFEEFISVLTQDYPTLLDVDTVSVAIEATSKEVPFISHAGMRFLRKGTVNQILGKGDALLQGNINGSEEIFGPGAGLVKSQALLRLEISENTPAGIIAFGSRDPEAFSPDQAIDQIGFLAQVVERCFRLWIDLQN
jgi:uncharacterized protein YigA (DUF484 family)